MKLNSKQICYILLVLIVGYLLYYKNNGKVSKFGADKQLTIYDWFSNDDGGYFMVTNYKSGYSDYDSFKIDKKSKNLRITNTSDIIRCRISLYYSWQLNKDFTFPTDQLTDGCQIFVSNNPNAVFFKNADNVAPWYVILQAGNWYVFNNDKLVNTYGWWKSFRQ